MKVEGRRKNVESLQIGLVIRNEVEKRRKRKRQKVKKKQRETKRMIIRKK